jgi:hypothetical protein
VSDGSPAQKAAGLISRCLFRGPQRASAPRRSGARRHGAEALEPGGRRLAFVVAHKGVEWRYVDGGRDMDRVQGSQGRLAERAGGQKDGAVERKKRNRVEGFSGSAKEQSEEPLIVHRDPSDRTGDLGKDEFTRDQVGAGEEGAQRVAFGLVSDQLYHRR